MLSNRQQETLRQLARNQICQQLGLETQPIDTRDSEFQKKRGLFVTLTKNTQLRGCIGSLSPHESILEGVKQHALNAAFHDNRFNPVSAEELADLNIEISILTEPVPLQFTDGTQLLEKLQPYQDGVTLRHETHFSTFLPQVWEQLPDPEQFLNHLAVKAGLGMDGWRQPGVEVETYTVIKF